MLRPSFFSWIERPHLAALARPESVDELAWLRSQGIQVLLSLTEDPPDGDEVSSAGLLLYHVPVPDMTAPTQDELDKCVSAIVKGKETGMGIAVHCGAGAGRTGVVLACYFVEQGDDAREAIHKIRRLRPGSIETDEQLDAVREFAQRRGR
jgi:atypical dual specificity phosphatase